MSPVNFVADSSSTAYQIGQVAGALTMVFFLLGVPLAFIVSLVFFVRSRKKGWLFLVIPSGLLTALFAVALVGAFAWGVVRGFNESARWKSAEKVPEDRLVASTDDKVNIKLPAHWSLLTNLNEAAQLQAGNPQREEYLIIINDAKGDFEGSLEQYADLVIGRLKESLDGAVVSDPEAVSVNNAKGTQYVISGSIQGLKLRYLFTILESDAGYHQVIEWTLNSKVESAFPVFREVLGTLSVSKAESS